MIHLAMAIALLSPARLYYQPDQPVPIQINADFKQADQAEHLLLLDPAGKVISEAALPGDKSFDLGKVFPKIWDGSTLYVQPVEGDKTTGVGPALVIVPLWPPDARQAAMMKQQRSGKPFGLKIYPEQHAVLHTTEGDMTIRFNPEVAPNTVANFKHLVAGGMYTNAKLHRIIPGFVIQGGDPTGTGMGGPGYWIDLEASGEKKHEEGTLSMARSSDPDSAGSQFFICLGRIPHLDPNDRSAGYAAFGDVVAGLDVMKKIAATPLADERAGKPVDPPLIKSAELIPAPPRNASK